MIFTPATDAGRLAAQVVTERIAHTSGAQFHGSIESAVARAIAARWGVQATNVQLEVVSGEWPADANAFRLLGDGVAGNWAVALEATGDRIIVRAGVLMRVVKAARDLERGTVLVDADMNADVDVIWGPPSRQEPLIEAGWLTKRRVRMGETLRPPVVEAPRAVRPGDVVTLVVERGSVTITLTGRAAGSAAIGERVAVRAGTGRRMEGVVVEAGVVRIGTPGDRR
jgi:flagella basal body P-ring formation protein FlgA